MLGKLALSAVLALFLCATAHTQGLTDKVELFGGYSFMRFDSSPSFNTNGWEISGQYKLNSWFGAMADFDGHYGTLTGLAVHEHDYLFGPQVSFPARVSPFAHVLLGGAHLGVAGGSTHSFASAVGFGIDSSIFPQISWRIIQVDYIHTHLLQQGEDNARFSTGIVVHF